LIALGYALGQPLSLNQGHVVKLTTRNSVRVIDMKMLEAGGASGGPVINADGKVVGLTQYGGVGVQESVDLAHLVRNDPTQLCFGVAAGQTATICPAKHAPTALGVDGPPQACAGAVVDL